MSTTIPFHPSYGYATAEQIDKLKELKVGPDYHRLLKEIEKQTKAKGKIK